MSLAIQRGRRNNRKSGKAAAKKAQKRTEAEERNARYQALSFKEKIARAGKKVREKLEAQQRATSNG